MRSRELGLPGVSGTLLVPLCARALARRSYSFTGFEDPAAERIVADLGIDPARIISDPASILGFIRRSQIFDRAIADFLTRHPDAIVIDLGAGLSTSFERLKTPPHLWYDVDLPPATDLHRRVIAGDPRRALIAASVDHAGWLTEMALPDGPVLVLAEGLLPYLAPEAITRLLADLADGLAGRTVEFVYDAFSFLMIGTARAHPAIGALARADRSIEFRSGVRTRADYTCGDPRWRLERIDDVVAGLPPPWMMGAIAFRAAFGVPLYAIVRLRLDAGGEPR
ncbi:class I SAM-dependent methyltransferase [Amorphus orientalis]|uniref:O-methyltransferase involved in polyketide biosynthesis n=1 Tax=Amorphus orientalis TaxID=649198 RepID=A0AAE3VQ22_9HYPH|nr:class I SAM-dependent methyltransferase [Amorphus orientalis]MDQ0315700.1 O-methyltransferase involved in polyketide biosynthesis [Amorphus orientalis]